MQKDFELRGVRSIEKCSAGRGNIVMNLCVTLSAKRLAICKAATIALVCLYIHLW